MHNINLTSNKKIIKRINVQPNTINQPPKALSTNKQHSLKQTQ